jgi:hypothetical protein
LAIDPDPDSDPDSPFYPHLRMILSRHHLRMMPIFERNAKGVV